jgi:hypothetical protein
MSQLADFIKRRDEAMADDATSRWGEVPAIMAGSTLVVAAVRHKYDGKLYHAGNVYWMADHRVASNVEAGIVVVAGNMPVDYWASEGRILGVEDLKGASPHTLTKQSGSLQILSGVGYDPGSAAFRLHSAVNEHTKHSMIFVRWGDTNPHCSERQYDGEKHIGSMRDAFASADVLHCHVAYLLINNLGLTPSCEQLLVRHYHGSAQNGKTHMEPRFDQAKQAKLLGARFMLVEEAKAFGIECDWSPIPMPVKRYQALRDDVRHLAGWKPLRGKATSNRPLVIGHSPTVSSLKGTDVLRAVVERLQKSGFPVRLEMISGVSLRESLRRKALCDVVFDSFWLGLQGSGLEAGAMEIPVIAGDAEVKRQHEQYVGECPYTFAEDAGALESQIELMATDPTFRSKETQRLSKYVVAYHDYSAVARRYEQSLARWLGRDDVLTEAQ